MSQNSKGYKALRHEIQLLKVSLSLVCDWIADKFDVELLDRSKLFSDKNEEQEINNLKQKISKQSSIKVDQFNTQQTNGNTNTIQNLLISNNLIENPPLFVQKDFKDGYTQHSSSIQGFSPISSEYESRLASTQKNSHGQEFSALPSSSSLSTIDSSNSDFNIGGHDENETASVIQKIHANSNSKSPKAAFKSKKSIKRPRKPKASSETPITNTSESDLTQSIQCEICGKFLNGAPALKRHMQTHTSPRPHVCPECGKSFQRNFHLKTHRMIHTGEKKHQCRFCGRLFLLPKDLIGHERTHTGEKPYSCDLCPKNFNLKSHLVCHIRTHTGEKPYQCDQCQKYFSQANSLRIHKKTHLTEPKPKPCSSSTTPTASSTSPAIKRSPNVPPATPSTSKSQPKPITARYSQGPEIHLIPKGKSICPSETQPTNHPITILESVLTYAPNSERINDNTTLDCDPNALFVFQNP